MNMFLSMWYHSGSSCTMFREIMFESNGPTFIPQLNFFVQQPKFSIMAYSTSLNSLSKVYLIEKLNIINNNSWNLKIEVLLI